VGLFGSKASRPESWTQLWEVLAPLDGSISPPGLQAWLAASVPEPTLRRANVQLRQAYAQLDTETLARSTRAPFTTPGQPFGYRRFLRVLDNVVLAGPEAVRRVVDDASALQVYDTLPALDPSAFYDEPLPTEPPLLTVLRGALDVVWPPERRPTGPSGWQAKLPMFGPQVRKSWPGLSDGWGELARADPSVPWLEIVSELDDRSCVGRPGCWEFSGYQAGKRLFAALGPDPQAVVPGAKDVMVELAPPGERPDEPIYRDDGVVGCMGMLTAQEYEVSEPAERIAIVTRRSAEALLRLRLSGQARQMLTQLAGPGD
jgi:hypothetical protein